MEKEHLHSNSVALPGLYKNFDLFNYELPALGHNVTVVTSLNGVLRQMDDAKPDFLLIEKSKICPEVFDLPLSKVVLLSANETGHDNIALLDLGADYIHQTESASVLAAHMSAIKRRRTGALSLSSPIVTFEDLEINMNERMVMKAGEPIHLTKKPLALLLELAQKKGSMVTKKDLVESLSDIDGNNITLSTLRTLVWRTNKQIGDSNKNSRYISTTDGVGYRLG